MHSTAFRCPGCRSAIQVPASVSVGRDVQCPRCRAVFPFGGGRPLSPNGHAAGAARSGLKRRPSRDDGAEPGADSRPNTGLIIGLVAGGVALLVVVLGVVGTYIVTARLRQTATDRPPVARRVEVRPEPQAAPVPEAPRVPEPAVAVRQPDPAPAAPAPERPAQPPKVGPPPAAPAAPPAAPDTIPLATLEAVKNATVFLRVRVDRVAASGSGFLVRVTGDTALVVTNHHVVNPSPPAGSGRPRPRLGFGSRPMISAVFWSGTRNERSARAEVLVSDKDKDLAVLRVVGIRGLPLPIDVRDPPQLVETMPVYIFGFPFGAALSLGNGNPAVTVGKGAVSSIRQNDRGEVAGVQIDGSINPGNSGGPVVDVRGRLVGVAVASIRGANIGLAIPAARVNQVLARADRAPEKPMAEPPADERPEAAEPAAPVPAAPEKKAGGDDDVTRILADLDSDQLFRRLAALRRLARLRPNDQRDRVAKALEPLVDDENQSVRTSAIKALCVWGTKQTVPVLIRQLTGPDVFTRKAVMEALGRIKDARGAAPIAARLTDGLDRQAASLALQAIGAPAEKAVQKYTRDADVWVRMEAVRILEAIGTRESLPTLRHAEGDSNPMVRQAAQNAVRTVIRRGAGA